MVPSLTRVSATVAAVTESLAMKTATDDFAPAPEPLPPPPACLQSGDGNSYFGEIATVFFILRRLPHREQTLSRCFSTVSVLWVGGAGSREGVGFPLRPPAACFQPAAVCLPQTSKSGSGGVCLLFDSMPVCFQDLHSPC